MLIFKAVVFLFAWSIIFPHVSDTRRIMRQQRKKLEQIRIQDLKHLVNIFSDCHVWLLVDSVEVSNIDEVQQPLKLYTKRKDFQKRKSRPYSFFDYDSYLGTEAWYNYQNQTPPFKPRGCNSFMLLLWDSESLQATNVFDVAEFRDHEIMSSYTVIMHKDTVRLPRNFYAAPKLSKGKSFYFSNHNHPLFQLYHLKLGKSPITSNDNELTLHHPSLEVSRPLPVYQTTDLMALSLDKTPRPETSRPCETSALGDCLRLLAAHSMTLGTNHAHEPIFLNLLKRKYHVDIHDLGIDATVLAGLTGRETSLEEMRSYVRRIKGAYGRASILTAPGFKLFPGELLIHELGVYFPNMTIQVHVRKTRSPPHGGPYERLNRLELSGKRTGPFIPLGKRFLTFVTCANVTSGLDRSAFWWPFDFNSWILLLVSTFVAASTLLLTAKYRGQLTLYLKLVVMIWRILLENLHDISGRLIKHPNAFKALVTIVAMTSIVLSNGYKGVLTSDFTIATVIKGPGNFEQILTANWTLAAFYQHSSRERQLSELKYNVLTAQPVVWHIISFVKRLKTEDILGIGGNNRVKNLKLLRHLYKKIKLIKPNWVIKECNQSALVILLDDNRQISLPKQLYQTMKDRPLVIAKEKLLEQTTSFTTEIHKEGILFKAIQKSVQAGLYTWIHRMFQPPGSGVQVERHVLKLQSNEPVPLSLSTAVVGSILWLWLQMSGAALASLILELVVNSIRITVEDVVF